jgi:hypothetical protein
MKAKTKLQRAITNKKSYIDFKTKTQVWDFLIELKEEYKLSSNQRRFATRAHNIEPLGVVIRAFAKNGDTFWTSYPRDFGFSIEIQ